MANPNPSPATRFKPGQSGNPGGGSKKRRATDEILALIAEKKADRAIAAKWLQAILEGDFRYFQAYLDRVEGKVPDVIKTQTSDDEPDPRILPARRSPDPRGGR